MIPIIKTGYTSKSGEQFDKVREIAYKKGEIYNNLGTLVVETKKKDTDSFDSFSDDFTTGVLIYQSNINPNVAYRIYKDYAECGYYDHDDYKFVQKFQERQAKVLLTKFPTGVVTLDGNVIGQEIPYFPESFTLYDFFERYKHINPIKIYRAVLNALKEMYDNGIVYLDIHPGNFLVKFDSETIKIETIDFEERYIRFDDCTKHSKDNLLENYYLLIQKLNKLAGIESKVHEMLKGEQFDDFYYQLGDMEKQLIKKK